MSTGPRRISVVVNQLLARRGYAQVQAVMELQESFAAIVGPALASHARAGNLKNGKLEILVADSSTMQEMVFMKRQLLQSLQQKLPQSGIKEIKYRIGK